MNRMTRLALSAVGLLLLGLVGVSIAQQAPPLPDPGRVKIDMDHILEGRVNRSGDLVGLHHAPSAPETIKINGRPAEVHFQKTSPGGPNDVRTARVQLLDPKTHEVLLDKSSTLFPDSWSPDEIEDAIREAYANAKKMRKVDSRGRWQGRADDGVRIDGYLTYDGKGIATAFPIYVQQNERPNRR